MGSNTSRKTCTNMKLAVICLALVATIASTHEDVDPFEFMTPEVSLFDDTPQENIVAAAQQLQSLSQRHMAVHVNEITKHAALVQEAATVEDEDESDKAKAYAHNFSASKAAITAALKGLNDQLVAGHNHDKAALSSAKGNADNSISSLTSTAGSKINGYKKQTCPAKRDEEAADEAKKSAKKVVDGIKGRKICPLSSTWGDMDVEKSVPKFGTELRNKWDKTRAEYSKAKAAYDSAVKAHQDATNKYNTAMAAFKTALTVEANNVHTACLNAHKEHKALATEVASNVASRKQVWIATLVVGCYVENLTSNSGAKACADKKRNENTSRWNITPPSLKACTSKSTHETTWGPKSWLPHTTNCAKHHGTASEKKVKETDSKEKAAKAEKDNKAKEKEAKKREAELASKESAAKHKEKNDKAAAKEKKAKADEQKSKELTSKEKAAKEKDSKLKERNSKESASKVKVTRHWWHGWINNWDGAMNWSVGGHTYISGLHSKHDNGREDRLFKPLLTSIGTSQASTHWSGWINNWDAQWHYTCPGNMAIMGLISYHDNGKEDRRWRIRCARFHGISISHGGWPGWQTNWDATWSIGCGHNPAVGFSSYHDNRKEDRRWRVQCGSIKNRL